MTMAIASLVCAGAMGVRKFGEVATLSRCLGPWNPAALPDWSSGLVAHGLGPNMNL